MPRIEPKDLEPLVGFATWHFEHEVKVEEVMERLRLHPAYSQFGDDAYRKVIRRALSDLRRWQRMRHCCGWTDEGGCCSWDEANQEMTRVKSRPDAEPPGNPNRCGSGPGDS